MRKRYLMLNAFALSMSLMQISLLPLSVRAEQVSVATAVEGTEEAIVTGNLGTGYGRVSEEQDEVLSEPEVEPAEDVDNLDSGDTSSDIDELDSQLSTEVLDEDQPEELSVAPMAVALEHAAYRELVNKSIEANANNPNNPKYSYEDLENFADKLKEDYVPVLLNNLEHNFESIRPTIEGLGMGLRLIYEPNAHTAASVVVSKDGLHYALEINLTKLRATAYGEVDISSYNFIFISYLQHELMHAVMFDITGAGMLGVDEYHGHDINSQRTIIVYEFPKWFEEGMAQAAGGGMKHLYGDNINGYYDLAKANASATRETGKNKIKQWLNKFYYSEGTRSSDTLYPAYSQGYVATM